MDLRCVLFLSAKNGGKGGKGGGGALSQAEIDSIKAEQALSLPTSLFSLFLPLCVPQSFPYFASAGTNPPSPFHS